MAIGMSFNWLFMSVLISFLLFIPCIAAGHCDTMEGPVVKTARMALEKGDVTAVLKWVKKEHEKEIREAFKKTLSIRGKGDDVRELADMYFFETLVRLHREAEGAPYTGLKSEDIEPIIKEADKSLESGSPDSLIRLITDAVAKGISERFQHARETRRHMDEGIDAGREFVKAYVEFTHYVERLHIDALKAHHHPASEEHHTH